MADAPPITGAKRSEVAAREARLAHALRDNLRRRKEQARARETRADGLPDNPGATGQGTNEQGANDEPPA